MHVFFQIIRMLAEKAKQQEEMLVEYDESEAQNKDLESEVELLRAQVDSMKEELKVGCCTDTLMIHDTLDDNV